MSQKAIKTDRYADRARAAILSMYRNKTPKSAALFARAAKVLPGGTTGNLRYFQPYPLYFSSGSGTVVVDLDGNPYIDCFLCNGPLLLGHRHPDVLRSLREYERIGSLVVNPPLAVEVAEEIRRTVPCAERVRFLNSGTEAVLTAVRIARAATGRNKIVKFFGHYHGQDDQFLVGLGPTPMAFGNGIPSESFSNVVLLPYGNIETLQRALEANTDVAAVILDPAMHSGGLWGSSTQYLRAVRDITAAREIALIFDEVITGFRLAAGGAQALHGVTPDLATFAKALGAGEKLAAVAGLERFMRGMDPNRPAGTRAVFQSGTGNDGTTSLAAAKAAIPLYRDLERAGSYAALNLMAERLAQGLRKEFRDRGIPFHANQHGPMLQLFLSNAEPSFEAFSELPTWPLELFYLALINEGILLSLPTSNHVYLSFVHTDTDMARILEKVSVVLDAHDFSELVQSAAAAT